MSRAVVVSLSITILFATAAAPAAAAGAPVAAAAVVVDDALAAERSARAKDALESPDPLVAMAGFARASSLFDHDATPGAEERFDRDAAAHARDPNVRAQAWFALAHRARRAGDVAAALKIADTLGFVTQARVIGPFSNTGGVSFAQPLVDVAGTQAEKVPGLERDVAWQTVPLDPYLELDVAPRIAPTKETRALYAVVVRAAAAGPAALRIGSSGQVRALWNGAEVARADVERSLGFDQTVAPVQLVKGDNLLAVEAGFLDDEASVRLRLTRPDGAPLAGLSFLVDEPAFKRAARTRAGAKADGAGVVDAAALARDVIAKGSAASSRDLRNATLVEAFLHASDLRKRPRDLEAGRRALVDVLERDKAAPPDVAEAHARYADALRVRDVSGARREYETALAQDPSCLTALLGLSSLKRELDDQPEARKLLQRAQAAAPSSDLVARRMLELDRSDGHGGSAVDRAILARAEAAPTDDNLDLAADVLDDRGDRKAALALLERAHDAGRANRIASDMAYAQMGALVASGSTAAPELETRVKLARAALAIRPGNHAQAEMLALTLVAAGKIDDAKALAAARAKEFPERAEPHALAAKLALIAGDRDAARASLTAALSVRPQDADLARTLRSLGENEEELVTRYGLDVDAVAQTPAAPEAARIGAEVLATTTAIRFFENGLGRIVEDRVIRVHDAKKAAGLQAFSYGYSEGRETLEVLVAERITKAGRREGAMRIVDNGPSGKESGVYTDVAQKTVVLGKLADGDIIHVRTRKELVGMQNLFGDFFGQLEPIQGTVPVQNWRLVVEAPLSRKLAWGGRNAPSPVVTEDKKGERRVYDFRVKMAPPIEPEPGMAPYFEVADFLSVSTYATWDALGAWYEKLIAPQFALDDDLKRVAADIKASSQSEIEKVQKVYEHVVKETRYVGIELGIHGWKPYPVAEVHKRKYGDCKDKASLLVALLREVGVPANIVLVRTANLGNIVPDPPSMWNFNHAIAYVPSLDLFLDGTAETSGFQETPPLDQGALVFIVGKHGDHDKGELRNIPVKPAGDNLNVSDYVLQIGVDGSLTLKGTETFRGSHLAEERVELADPATRMQLLEKHLAAVMPGTHIKKLDVSDLGLDQEEISYTFEAVLPERAVKQSDGSLVMAISLYPHDLSGSYAQLSTRKTDIFLDHPWRTRNVMRYVLPPGYTVDLPSGGTVKSDTVQFTQKVTRTPDGFIVDEDTAIMVRRIPASAYPEFRDACLRADALMKRTVRLKVAR